uniref:Aminopeptidase n=1 Tax=Haemonchus contortus TaxID=6289 RepID=A0A140EQJ4_HAECO|nr:aminopeptidase [Haemonchus contortus]
MGIMAVAGVVILIIVAVVACGIPLGWFGETTTKRSSSVTDILDFELFNYSNKRLPKDVRPVKYDLKLKVYLPAYVNVPENKILTFEGDVEITAKVLASVHYVVLHMEGLSLDEKNSEISMNGRIVPIRYTTYTSDIGILYMNQVIPANEELKIKLKYSGKVLKEPDRGLYNMTYKGRDGSEKVGVVAQLEAIYARRVVPCFDEPDFKAVWSITVIHPEGTIALSNGKEISSEKGPETSWITTTFDTTPVMSSYLFTIAIGEFDYEEFDYVSYQPDYHHDSYQPDYPGVKIRTYTIPGEIQKASYALNIGTKCLDFFENYSGIKYPLPKLDMIAFSVVGALENWGLITFKEASLLYDELTYPLGSKYEVAATVAHEIAHQWFGNLVTMKWWDEVWLNEGFATYLQYISLEEVTGGVNKLKDHFATEVMEIAFMLDRPALRSLRLKVERPQDIAGTILPIVYFKGAAFIAMVVEVIGEKNFNEGIKHYLTKFSYGNARSTDLWESLETTNFETKGPDGNPLNLTAFASPWTRQAGFPLVTVDVLNSSTFEITQYPMNKVKDRKLSKDDSSAHGVQWDIPIWYQLNDNPVKFAWLSKDKPLYIRADTENDILVVNGDRHGFYRQNYAEEGWKKIIKKLTENPKIYSLRTRSSIIVDAFEAALENFIDYSTALDALQYLEHEKEYLVWKTAKRELNSVAALGNFFNESNDATSYKGYVRNLLKPIFKPSFFDDVAYQSVDKEYLLPSSFEMNVIDMYCQAEAEECMAAYAKIFKKFVLDKCCDTCWAGQIASNCVDVPPPLKKGTYCYGVKILGSKAFEKVNEMAGIEKNKIELTNLRLAVSCHDDEQAIKSFLKSAVEEGSFTDIIEVFHSVSKNHINDDVLFTFLSENWEQIYNRFQNNNNELYAVVEAALSKTHTESDIQRVKKFIEEHKEANKIEAFSKRIGVIEDRIAWKNRNYEPVVAYFKSHS